MSLVCQLPLTASVCSLLAADLPGNVSYAPVYMMAEDRGLATSHFHMLEPRLEVRFTAFAASCPLRSAACFQILLVFTSVVKKG